MKKLLIVALMFVACNEPSAKDDAAVRYKVASDYIANATRETKESSIAINMQQAGNMINEMPADDTRAKLQKEYIAAYSMIKKTHPQALMSPDIIQPVDTGAVN